MWQWFIQNVWPNLVASIAWVPLSWLGTHLIVRHHVKKIKK